MRKYLFSRIAVPAAGVVALLTFLIPGQASADVSATAACPDPAVSQPFLSWGDSAWYTAAPGVTPDSFTAAGWTLTGGATVTIATLADGQTGPVLDLPPGSSATSPEVCVDSSEPTGSMVTRAVGINVPVSELTRFYVTPVGSSMTGFMPIDSSNNWAEARPVNVVRGIGAEDVYLTLASSQTSGDVQVYDLYIDPHMRF